MDTYIKRLQTRASKQGVKVSKDQVRAIYPNCVADPSNPTEVEMALALGEIIRIHSPKDLAIAEPETIEITPESNPDAWENLQPPTEETVEETSAIAPQSEETSPSALTTTNSSLTQQEATNLTQREIESAINQHFGKESQETKSAILNYIAKDTFTTATELRAALSRLRETKLEILMKVVNDYNQESSADQNRIQDALTKATQQRQEESNDFLAEFESRLQGMRAAFGL